MLARQRQDAILDQVTREGGARVAELVERFGVSDMTVRRDIQVPRRARHGSAGRPDEPEQERGRAMIASAHRLVVVADHSKWHVVGLSAIAPISEVDILVTDDKLPEAARRALEAQVGRLIVVDGSG